MADGLPDRRATGVGFSLNIQGCHISDLNVLTFKCCLFVQTDRRAAGGADLRTLAGRVRGRHLPPLRGE